MDCPKRYGSYDVSNCDCPKCGKGFLYQTCTIGKTVSAGVPKAERKDHSACGGWNDEHGQPYCCTHYEEKFAAVAQLASAVLP